MEEKGSNQSLVKNTNQMLIIKTVRQQGQISRTEMARMLSLSNPSVSKNVDDLLAKGILVETGSRVTDVGRRPIMLEFNANRGCVAVVDLSGADGRICIADLNGNKLKYSRVEGGKLITADILNGIIVTLRSMLRDMGSRHGKLVSICIGVPGVIEPKTGRIHWSARIENFREVDLKGMFTQAFNVPVTVKNDVNLAVCGERDFGCGNGARDMIYMNIDAGIGIGIVLDGKLYEGTRGFAGDLGVVMPDIYRASEGSGGDFMAQTMENNLSVYHMISDVAKMFDSGRETVLRTFVSDSSDITFNDIVKAYGMGDNAVISVMARYAKLIAVLMKNLVSLFDVELMVLGGPATRLGSTFINQITEYMLSLPGYAQAQIRGSRLLDTAVIYGGNYTAAQSAIEHIVSTDKKI